MTGYLFLLAFVTSVIGAICGVGGGILIKPVLDAVGRLDVNTINFLSGCTVLSMTIVTVCRSLVKKSGSNRINLYVSTPLAIGAAAGGSAGKILFTEICEAVSADNIVGMIQSVVLLLITGGTLFYYIMSNKIKTLHLSNQFGTLIVGLLLGICSSFLGIGGGPINIVILSYFFSMNKRESAANSIYIILFSQLASLIYSLLIGSIPRGNLIPLTCMIAGGVIGGNSGCLLHHKMKEVHIDFLFLGLLFIIILLNCFNIFTFLR